MIMADWQKKIWQYGRFAQMYYFFHRSLWSFRTDVLFFPPVSVYTFIFMMAVRQVTSINTSGRLTGRRTICGYLSLSDQMKLISAQVQSDYFVSLYWLSTMRDSVSLHVPLEKIHVKVQLVKY